MGQKFYVWTKLLTYLSQQISFLRENVFRLFNPNTLYIFSVIHFFYRIRRRMYIFEEMDHLKFVEILGRRKGNKQNNDSNHTGMFNGTRPQRSVIPSGKRKCVQGCHFRLIERCTWPQCNHSCPKLHNPFTGEEMDFIELLKSFGLDMKSVANALGIDIQTLNSMDHDELLNLLTQRAN